MKHYSLLLILLLSCFVSYGYNNKQEVDMNEINPISKQTRSTIYKPTVYIDADIQRLSITFRAVEKNCNVYILNDCKMIVYQSFVVTGGFENTYNLPHLDAGNYKIIIEGQAVSYDGMLSL